MAIYIDLPDGRRLELEGDQFRIVSGADAPVAFPGDARVRPNHAVLRRTAGRWMIEARDGEQIRVGNDPPARMHWLTPGDVVRLTERGPEFVFQPTTPAKPPTSAAQTPIADAPPPPPVALMVAPSPPVIVETAPAAKPATPARRDARTMIALAAVAVCVVVMTIVGLAGGFRSSPSPTTEKHPVPNRADQPGVAPPIETAKPTPPASNEAAPESQRALSLVLVRQEQGQTFQLGTAWAAGKRQLVTSAAIVTALEDLRDIAPAALVSSPTSRKEAKIVRTRVHPQYKQALGEAKVAQGEAESLRLDLEEKKPPAEVAALTEKIVAAEERRFLALERLTFYDVAVLDVDADLPLALSLAESSSGRPRAGSRVVLAGVPFAREEFLVDPDSPAPPQDSPGNVLLVQNLPGDSGGPFRVVIKCRLDLSGQNWSGSPVLNPAGQVIAVYSRPTPPDLDPKAPASVTSHDATDINRLREFASEFK